VKSELPGNGGSLFFCLFQQLLAIPVADMHTLTISSFLKKEFFPQVSGFAQTCFI
jgi:hypothetical protein